MKRDWEVIRKILLKLEANPSGAGEVTSSDFQGDGIDNDAVAYNMFLLSEAALIEGGGRSWGGMGSPYRFAIRLTWEGHELLDHIRSDTMWNKVKQRVAERGLDLSIDSVVAAGKALVGGMLAG